MLHRVLATTYQKSLFLITVSLCQGIVSHTYSQEITAGQAFFYYMKLYEHTPEDKTITCGSFEGKKISHLEFYCKTFDTNNYNKNKNDEFSFQNYLTTMRSKLLTGISKVDYSKKFIANTSYAKLNDYSFDDKAFPIYVEERKLASTQTGKGFGLSIGNVINWFDIFLLWSISPDEGNNLIKRRKDQYGNINREVFLKVTYSIVNRKIGYFDPMEQFYDCGFGQRKFYVYVYTIEIFDDKARTIKLGQITPKTDYYDKINGVKLKEGQDTTYYDWLWKEVKNSTNASYYGVINYVNEEISGAVKYFYISGKIQMIGYYNGGYWLEEIHANGMFTWYYENGIKESEVEQVINGKWEGKFSSWHPNGNKKLEVHYVNGLKEGCEYQWEEDGTLVRWRLSPINYYEHGENIGDSDSKCNDY